MLWLAEQDDREWVVSEEILAEYRDVLRRPKFNIPDEKLVLWEEIITKLTHSIDVTMYIDFPRDQKDAMFLTCALVSHADFMITGDSDFSEMKKLTDTALSRFLLSRDYLSIGKIPSCNLIVTWNTGRQGDAMPSLPMSELMGWWEEKDG